MKLRVVTVVVALAALPSPASAASAASGSANKDETSRWIDGHAAELAGLSDQVWSFAETALRETRSSRLLADTAEKMGFTVQRGVAGLPTAFTATYGQGSPVIGVLGEFDALPGLSQKAVPRQEALAPDAPGHGCGHNLFGVGSLAAAAAVKELIAAGKLKGTVRFYGTPAEESVGGKLYMLRAGLFKDLDVCVAWHPDTKTRADMTSGQALVDFIVEFKGKAAHAAFDPWNGRSAVDGLELFTHGLNMMREHVKPSVRIHYTIQKGGDVPNVVPEYARLWCWVRDWTGAGVNDVLARVRQAAEGAAMMAGVESKLTVQAGDYEMLINEAGARLLDRNLERLGPITYTTQEQEFARELQKSAGVEPKGVVGTPQPIEGQEPEGGSTDVGDVSWNVPVIHLSATTAPVDVPWHAWPVVASGGMSIGHKGMVYAAKALAATMVDLFEDPAQRQSIRAEFLEKTRGFVYKPYIPEGPPPLLADRP